MRKATAPQPAPEHTDEPELVVDREFRSPRPLDRNISTVSLKTPTNNVTEGYDLLLSATFGKERITLVSEQFEIEVDFSMTKLRKVREPELRRLVAQGLTKAEIAKRLNVSPATISNWRRKLGI